MSTEIERKFRVTGEFRDHARDAERIVQGFLSSVPERTVRVRKRNGRGYLTIKGKGDSTGTTRYEWEREIPPDEADALLALCEPGIIDKTRHYVPVDGQVFEVDEFHGENAGLIVAELELVHADDPIPSPPWLGPEVTGDARYYNAALKAHPYSQWLE
ncbi:MAG: CYTH domain-containing protein [Halofilum sp. (in: g-proteobacteria)]|nr:CYTH domain-containing protein [Halofilum sp. (in: g-proteobacteria)]